eukprot:sb/3468695/
MKTNHFFLFFFHLNLHLSSSWNHGNWTGSITYQDDYEIKLGWPDYFESLLLKYNVDLVLAGHVHHYERSWPVWERNNTVQSYSDVTKPVHITCGHAGKNLYKYVWGSNNKNDTYSYPKPAFSAARTNTEWGHCELEFLDKNTVRHKMFVVGNSEPKEDVTITKKRSIHGNWTGKNTPQYDGPDDLPVCEGWPDHFEDLILAYKVDIVLAAHVHQYERSWPVWGRDNVQQSYNDVTAPVHITCGNAGKSLYK